MVMWLLFTTLAEVAIIALLSMTEFSLLGFYHFFYSFILGLCFFLISLT